MPITFKAKNWTNEQLAMRLWHLLCGDDRTPTDQRIWRTGLKTDQAWSLSNNDWFFTFLAQDKITGLKTYMLCHSYAFTEAELRALATVLEILLDIGETEIS